MQQKYVLYFRDSLEMDLVDDLKHVIPGSKVLERRGQLFLIESPIHEEEVLYAIFEDANVTLSRNRTYNLIA